MNIIDKQEYFLEELANEWKCSIKDIFNEAYDRNIALSFRSSDDYHNILYIPYFYALEFHQCIDAYSKKDTVDLITCAKSSSDARSIETEKHPLHFENQLSVDSLFITKEEKNRHEKAKLIGNDEAIGEALQIKPTAENYREFPETFDFSPSIQDDMNELARQRSKLGEKPKRNALSKILAGTPKYKNNKKLDYATIEKRTRASCLPKNA